MIRCIGLSHGFGHRCFSSRWTLSANQSISPSANQPVSQSASQPISQSASQPISQPANQPISQPANQSANQPISNFIPSLIPIKKPVWGSRARVIKENFNNSIIQKINNSIIQKSKQRPCKLFSKHSFLKLIFEICRFFDFSNY